MDKYGNCPKCGESWDDGLIIDNFRKQKEYKDLSEEELEAKVKDWYAPPYKFSKIVGIEIIGGYDGVSYWQCPFCKTTWDRFTGEKREICNAWDKTLKDGFESLPENTEPIHDSSKASV